MTIHYTIVSSYPKRAKRTLPSRLPDSKR